MPSIESRYPAELGLLPSGNPSTDDVRQFYNFAMEIFKQTQALLGPNS
jgi:hypothetical protein